MCTTNSQQLPFWERLSTAAALCVFGSMPAMLGVLVFLGVRRSYAIPHEHGHALAAVDDAPFLTDHLTLESDARECSARQRGAEECLAAVREAAYRWLYATNKTNGIHLPPLTSNEREKQASPDAFPQPSPSVSPQPSRSGVVSNHHPWRALQTNWWMPFIDGWAHKCGATAFDQAQTITQMGGDGRLSEHLHSHLDKFSDYNLMHETILSIDMVEAMNMELQGLSWATNPAYGSWEVASPYSEFRPRDNVWAESSMMGYTGAVHVDKAKIFEHAKATQDWGKVRGLYYQVRVNLTGAPLDQFYAAITKDDCNITRFTNSLADHSHPRAALGCLLPAAATLYATMAELHPFIDGNSRTRLMVLNTQLARAGAHPVVLYNNGWGVYHMNNLEELEEYLLGGYCAWEYVLATGESPYVGHSPDFDCANPPYENHTDMRSMGANRSPVPLYDWENDECIIPQGLRSRA